MISIARILGAPLRVPAGKVARSRLNASCSGRTLPRTSLTMCMTWL